MIKHLPLAVVIIAALVMLGVLYDTVAVYISGAINTLMGI